MGKQWKQWQIFFLEGGSIIIADGGCSHEIKRHLLLGRKTMTNPDSILKSRDITLLTKVCIDKAMVFLVVMHRYESWAIKKDEYWRSDAFKLWCWRRCLRVSSTTRRSSQSILKEINPEYSLEGLMLKLKLQYFGHLMFSSEPIHWKRPWCWERLRAAGEGWQRMRWLDGITDSMDLSLSNLQGWWWTGEPGMLQSMRSQRVRHNWATELNWTEQ